VSTVADHTALVELASAPVYRDVLLRQYLVQRSILVIPSVSLMVATGATPGGDFSELLTNHIAVRHIELDAHTAHRIGTEIPVKDPGEWPVTAPVIWAARALAMPIVTADTALEQVYAGYGVPVVRMP
jgi:hypothetical protein